MLNQKTLRKHKKHKNNSERLLLGPPKIRRIRKPKNLGETKKTKKTKKPILGKSWGKGGPAKSLWELFFLFFYVFLVFPRFFCFLVFLILGGPAKSLPELFFLFVCFPMVFGSFWFFLMCFLSFMHIYQCFLVLIVALMHLPNIYEHLWKTKTQAPWPPLLFKFAFPRKRGFWKKALFFAYVTKCSFFVCALSDPP